MIHPPLADVLGVDILTLDPRDREDEPLDHQAHRVRLVLEAGVFRIFPHGDNPVCLVVVENLGEMWEHDAMHFESLQSSHLSCGVAFAGHALLAW